MDKFKIDNHKLMFHVSRVNDWLNDKNIYPIYMEISPFGACNHRCVYCGLDFMNYQSRYLKTPLLKSRLSELGELGLKSVMYAGEGEPLLHQDLSEIIEHTRRSGIDVSITTNGVLLNEEMSERILGEAQWIKISLDATTPETFSKIHRCHPDDFNLILKNISCAVKLKNKHGFSCTLGAQFLLLPENEHEVIACAKIAKDIGLDYLVIKPYSQHIQSKTKTYNTIKYENYEYLADELQKFNSGNFSAIFRIRTMKKWDKKEKLYKRCLALPFWSYIDAGGSVWGCSVFINVQRFLYGNIYEQTFKEIWEGEKRMQSLRWIEEEFDATNCRVNCRMDEINRYLWELENPPQHVNFI
ncbi:radical SAM protein [Candidatus Omnitrophota bacterium]